MRIALASHISFCEGVRRAYELVQGFDIVKAKKPVCILGALVHNPEVNRKVEQRGIKNITREDFFGAKEGELGTVIITAHGTGPDVFREAKKKNIVVFDTTCPKVMKVQKLAELYARKGFAIVLVGDKKHKEVRGINDWGDQKAYIISEQKDWEKLKFAGEKHFAVLSQTTQNEEFFNRTAKFLVKKFPALNFEIFNTTCSTTRERQQEIKQLARDNDGVLVIGSKTSANSRRLWEISKKLNPRSYFIENAQDIRPTWFKQLKSVAVTSGASTPDWVIREVIDQLKDKHD